ncbi:MAG TPA: translation initiation factor IF-3 [Opitutaceae bacterium]
MPGRSSGKPAKEIEFSARIDASEYQTKIRRAGKILGCGENVKLFFKFRGREMAHTAIGFEVIKRVIADLAELGQASNEPKLIGRNVSVTITPVLPKGSF